MRRKYNKTGNTFSEHGEKGLSTLVTFSEHGE